MNRKRPRHIASWIHTIIPDFLTEEQYAAQKSALDLQFSEALSSLQASKAELDKNQAAIDEGRIILSSAKEEIAQGWAKIEDGRSELETAKQKLSDAEKEISKIEHPDSYVLDRDTNVGYVCFDNDTSIVEGIAKVFPVFFFSGCRSGLYDYHEQDDRRTAYADRRAEGIRLQRRPDPHKIYVLFRKFGSSGRNNRILCRDIHLHMGHMGSL